MNELSRKAQSLFDAARSGYEPSEAARDLVLRGVLAQTALASSGWALAGKAALRLVFGALVGVGLYGAGELLQSSGKHDQPAVVRIAPRPVASSSPQLSSEPASARSPVPATLSVQTVGRQMPNTTVTASPALEQRSAGASPSPPTSPAMAAFPETSASVAPSANALGSVLSEEARALAEVQRALREGRSADALMLVEQQQRRFPHGELGQERQAARIVALCAAGRVNEARAAAERFLVAAPNSPVAARIRTTCASP